MQWQSKHGESVRKALEDHGSLSWAELGETTGLNDAQIKRGIAALGTTIVRIPKQAKRGEVLAYALRDPGYLLQEMEQDQSRTPLYGLTSIMCISKQMKKWLGDVAKDWDGVARERRDPHS